MAKRKINVKKNRPTTWQEAMQAFLFWKQAQGLSERTISDYRSHVNLFFNRHPEAYNGNVKSAALEYMASPVKPATFNLRLTNLSAFFKWCVGENIFDENPLDGIKRKKSDCRVVNLNDDTLTKLLTLPDKTTFQS